MEKYVPPFTISNKMLELVGNIMEKVGKLDNFSNLNKMPVLRRNNRIHSIHSSLAIEANSLSFNQVKDVINGKLVLGDKKEIQEDNSIYKFEFENILMDTPKTSDGRNTILYIIAFIMSAAGIVIISVAEHKRRKNNKQK